MKITRQQLRQIIREEITTPEDATLEDATPEEQIVTHGNYRGFTLEEAAVLKQLHELTDLAYKTYKMLKIERHGRKNSSKTIQKSKYVVEQLAKEGIDSSKLSQYVQASKDARKAIKLAADKYYSYLP